MDDSIQIVEMEIVYDPSTHKEKLQNIVKYTTTLKNAKVGNTAMAIGLMSVFPQLKEAEKLIEYFNTLIKYGIHFGVVIDKSTIKELDELKEAINMIRRAARIEFRFNATTNTSGR